MAQRLGRGIALLFHDHGTRRGECSAAHPGRTLPPGKTWYPLTEMSTRNIYYLRVGVGGVEVPVRRADNVATLMCRMS